MGRPLNLIDRQRLAGFGSRRADILRRIEEYHAAGDGFHVDEQLDLLREWERERTEFLNELTRPRNA